ncbi:MAG: hypothetical protein EAX90_15665 [Candidatus Heimdallarchaeota archaeon]|nr:hypothetical protein [Candidatus Heimdallarchaeota archaeon]
MERKKENLIKITKTIPIISLLVIGILLSLSINCIDAKNSNLRSNYSINKYIEEDKVVEWGSNTLLMPPTLYPGGRVFINITVLPSSLSNISLAFTVHDGIVWSPVPPTFTLQIGEYYSNTFTLVSSSIDNADTLKYSADVLIENVTATVRFGYEVLDKGTDNLPTITSIKFFITLSIIVIALNITLRKKAQK